MLSPHVIVLAVDGLRAAPIGAYGGPVATPEIDRFAARSTVYDWFFSDAPELDRAYTSLWADVRELVADRRATLLTDDPHDLDPGAVGFHGVETFQPPNAAAPAEALADTWLATRLGEYAEAIARCRQRAGPHLIWMHTQGFFGPWDAPVGMVEAMLDEEDPPVEPSVAPASGTTRQRGGDAGFAASCRYAAQLQVFDACFGRLVEVVDNLFDNKPLTLALVGTRGFALGEHGVLGFDDRLYAESLHAALMIANSDGAGALRRVGRVTGSTGFAGLLAGGDSGGGDSAGPLRQSSRAGARSVHQANWRLLQPSETSAANPRGGGRGPAELYLKPDDRWETNDVASLMPEVVAEMQALLPPPVDVAADGDGA